MILETIAVKVANVDATVNILQKTTNASNEKLTLDTNSMRTINHQLRTTKLRTKYIVKAKRLPKVTFPCMAVHLFAQESARCLFGELMTLEIHAVKMANVDAIVNIPQKTTNAIKEKLILDTNSLHTIDHQLNFTRLQKKCIVLEKKCIKDTLLCLPVPPNVKESVKCSFLGQTNTDVLAARMESVRVIVNILPQNSSAIRERHMLATYSTHTKTKTFN